MGGKFERRKRQLKPRGKGLVFERLERLDIGNSRSGRFGYEEPLYAFRR